MFRVNIGDDSYKVCFRHNLKKQNNQLIPKSTACIITKDDVGISMGVAAPIKEHMVEVSCPEAAVTEFGHRLKKVYKLTSGWVALLKGDNFEYSVGRKLALQKALASFGRDERTAFWDKYHEMEKKGLKNNN